MKRKGPKIMEYLPISKMFSKDSFQNEIKRIDLIH